MAETCVFCRIVNHKMDAEIVYQDDELTAFHDNNPQAPTHILIVPNRHIPNLNATGEGDVELLGRMLDLARELAGEQGVQSSGYRLVLNTGDQAGQSVHHMHLHVLGGRQLHWPPG